MESLRIYVQKMFLETFFELKIKSMNDLLKNDLAQKVLFIDNLLQKVTEIFIDIDQSSINNLVIHEGINEDNCFNFFLKQYAELKIIKPCPIDLMNPEEVLSIKHKTLQPHYLLLDCDAIRAKKYEQMLGIICISNNLNSRIRKDVYSLKIESIKQDTTLEPNSLLNNSPSHSVIIEDPFIININEGFLNKIISSLLNSLFSNTPLHIILLGQNETYINRKNDRPFDNDKYLHKIKNFQKVIDKINNTNNKIHIELLLVNEQKLHDRHILSNSLWIVCGHSFKEKYNTNTEWQFRPIGTYFKQFKKRIDFINTSIKRGVFSYTTTNSVNKLIDVNKQNILIR